MVRRSVSNLPFFTWACVWAVVACTSVFLLGRLTVFSAQLTSRDLKTALEQSCCSLFVKLLSEKYIQLYPALT